MSTGGSRGGELKTAYCRYFFDSLPRTSVWTNFDAAIGDRCRMNWKCTYTGCYKKTGHRLVINLVFVGTVTEADKQWSCYVTISCDKMIKIIIAIHRRRQGTEVRRWYNNCRSTSLSFSWNRLWSTSCSLVNMWCKICSIQSLVHLLLLHTERHDTRSKQSLYVVVIVCVQLCKQQALHSWTGSRWRQNDPCMKLTSYSTPSPAPVWMCEWLNHGWVSPLARSGVVASQLPH